jgi:hypothetical protein
MGVGFYTGIGLETGLTNPKDLQRIHSNHRLCILNKYIITFLNNLQEDNHKSLKKAS